MSKTKLVIDLRLLWSDEAGMTFPKHVSNYEIIRDFEGIMEIEA
jgi:hypothetical protein